MNCIFNYTNVKKIDEATTHSLPWAIAELNHRNRKKTVVVRINYLQ